MASVGVHRLDELPAYFAGHLWVPRGYRPPLFARSMVEYVVREMLSDQVHIERAVHIRAGIDRSGTSQRHGVKAGGSRDELLPGFLPHHIIRQQSKP